jgi:hypothetical protein
MSTLTAIPAGIKVLRTMNGILSTLVRYPMAGYGPRRRTLSQPCKICSQDPEMNTKKRKARDAGQYCFEWGESIDCPLGDRCRLFFTCVKNTSNVIFDTKVSASIQRADFTRRLPTYSSVCTVLCRLLGTVHKCLLSGGLSHSRSYNSKIQS